MSRIHLLSLTLGAGLTLGLGSLASMQMVSDAQRIFILTPEQAEILSHMSLVDLDDGQGGTARTLRIEGVNLQVVNGTGSTASQNGVGNLIVGYNELLGFSDDRTGSHNVVAGQGNQYTSHGGMVLGTQNRSLAPFATVSGGSVNVASGGNSSIGGGSENEALAFGSSVSGGAQNRAEGAESSISGGRSNTASNMWSSVSGGNGNTASGRWSSVSGGVNNLASAFFASISGGEGNQALELGASVSAGLNNTANGEYCSVSGGEGNTAGRGSFGMGFVNSASVAGGVNNIASGFGASVAGGSNNEAGRAIDSFGGTHSHICGGRNNDAVGTGSTVSGGADRSVTGDDDWRAGTLFEDF